jgi:hypothetical protein
MTDHLRIDMNRLYQSRKGALARPGPGTLTQRLYRQWVENPDQREEIETALAHICAKACVGLCPPVEPDDQSMYGYEMFKRFGRRWPWCRDFVQREVRRTTPYDSDPDCRYIARRCRQRLIDEIRRANRPIGDRARDERGRFIRENNFCKPTPIATFV